ncbi:ABC transporter [Qipengyuania sp. JC766]|uniref:ABC transporter n=1 Tax=Qipengyuania sp. JC766 TaxID=3232139 RepID=UPI00345898B7
MKALLLGLVSAGLAACAAEPAATDPVESAPSMGLMTSLPIYWSEARSMEEMLAPREASHWLRDHLEDDFRLVPLDTLAADAAGNPSSAFAGLDLLLLAQSPALPPEDFVALDRWVRDGGEVLIFADPLLTEHSEFGLGDRRRPLDIALMDTILARWGLALGYDGAQPEGYRTIEADRIAVPVREAGFLEPEGAAPAADCRITGTGLLAECTIGQGRAVILADAAMLEHDGSEDQLQQRTAAFDSLLALLRRGNR